MTKEEFNNTKWTTGMSVETNGIRSELISVNLRTRDVCIFYAGGRVIWLPCELVNLVKKEGERNE